VARTDGSALASSLSAKTATCAPLHVRFQTEIVDYAHAIGAGDRRWSASTRGALEGNHPGSPSPLP